MREVLAILGNGFDLHAGLDSSFGAFFKALELESIRNWINHIGDDEQHIKQISLDNKEKYAKMAKAVNPYGDGHACKRIADILEGKEYQEWKN